MKVFYSWQSDTPNKVGRTFIREALDAAVAGLDLEEAARPVIDQDTAGVLGSPVIADTIFQKIREARVVVADVTLTGQTPDGKRLCNSNVAIELGYALGIHDDGVLLKVMNTHYGLPQDLPFDLAHRRWPVQFNLSPDAKTSERQIARAGLTHELRKILEAYVAASRPPPVVFVPTPSTDNAAAYWQKGESLATIAVQGRDDISLLYGADQPLIYLRIWPTEKIPPLPIPTLGDYNKSSIEPLCGTTSGWSNERNRYGALAYADLRSRGELAATTQVLKTGEIWGINAYLLRNRENYPKFVPTGAYERGVQGSLARYLDAARNHFGYPAKIMIETGLVNVSGFKLSMPQNYDEGFWGPIYENVKVVSEVDMDRAETISVALLRIFEAVFEAAGTPRPKNLNNFPNKGA
jgi:hypothetical protein